MYCLFEESDALNSPIECFEYNIEKNVFPVKPHWHYFMEIIYVMSGEVQVYAGEQGYTLSAGDMILFMPKTIHSIYAVPGNAPYYEVFKFDINCLNIATDYSPKLRSIFSSAEKKGMNIFFGSEITKKFSAGAGFSLCIAEMKKKKYGYDMVIKAEIYKLLINVLRVWQTQGFQVDSDVYSEDTRFDIYNITEYIDENLTEGIKVTDISQKCGMSYSYFARKFSEVYGKTCKEYIEQMRIYKVEEYLMFTDFELSYIAQETGFADCSHMIKKFSRAKGITPGQFRLRHNRKTTQN
ncbi:MAG: AraC family transcriptional regulator [Oscillospiraceae bacterium]|nr:AraC family transcriptional regulator [Oscillospiraceae bacterium]